MNYYEMIQEGLKYNYYNFYTPNGDIDIIKDAKKYIEEYFQLGHKMHSLYNKEQSLLLNFMRSSHMISLYGLGAFIIKKTDFEKSIPNTYTDIIPSDLINQYNNDALYYWFLTALYHDIGYNHIHEEHYEYDLFNYKNSVRNIIIKCVEPDSKRIFQMYYDKRFDSCYKIRRTYSEPFKRYVNIYEYSPYILNSYYHPFVYKKYHLLRNKQLIDVQSSDEKIEHGVYGGRLFYDNMVKVLLDSISDCTIHNGEYWMNNQLVWFPEQLDIFKDIAMVIATHNIWKNALYDYKIKSGFRRISRNNPLLYLLCIVDNIDLYKQLYWLENRQQRDSQEIVQLMKAVDVFFEGKTFKMTSKKDELGIIFKTICNSINKYIDVDVNTILIEGTHTLKVTFDSKKKKE